MIDFSKAEVILMIIIFTVISMKLYEPEFRRA